MLASVKPAEPAEGPRSRFAVTPVMEVAVVLGAVAVAVGTYVYIDSSHDGPGLIAPTFMTGMLLVSETGRPVCGCR